MADYNRSARIEVYHMIEEANISIAGNNESSRTEKIPQVLADFHVCIDKLTELQGTGKSFSELSPREQAEAFIASASVNHIINKVEDSLVARNKVSHQEVIERCGVTDLYEQTLQHFDPIAHPDAVHENPYIEDRAMERIDHFYTDYNHAENDTIGVENYSCYLLPGEENPVDPDDPFRTETNPDYHSFLMEPNEDKLENYRVYTGEAAPDRVDRPEPEEGTERKPSDTETPHDTEAPADHVSAGDAAPKTDPEIYRFLSSAIRFPLEILNSSEAADYVANARGEKGLQEFEAAKSGLISAVREGSMDGVTKCAHAIQHQLDLCEKKTGVPLEITSLRTDRIDRLADLGERAFTGSDGKLVRLNQTDPWRAWAVLKFDIGVLTTRKEDWEARYHTEKPSTIGAAGRCVAGFLGLINSLSGTGIFTAYSNAVFKGLLDYADRMEKEPDRGIDAGRETESGAVSIEAVAKYSAMEITSLLERPEAPEIEALRDALGEDRFSEFQTEIREYLDTNDSGHWERAQEILESAAGRRAADVERRDSDAEPGRTSSDSVSRRDPDDSAGPEKYIQRLRDIDAHQNRHGEYSSLFSFDSNGNEYRTTGMRRLDSRDTVESFRFMTSVISAYAHGGKMDFQLTGRELHEAKAVGLLDVFMSVNHFLHSDIGYTVIKYAFEHAKNHFVDIRAADTRDLFEQIVSDIENGPEDNPPDALSMEDIRPEPPSPPDYSPPGPGDTDARRGSSDEDDLIAASEEDTDPKSPEEAPHSESSEKISPEASGSAFYDTESADIKTDFGLDSGNLNAESASGEPAEPPLPQETDFPGDSLTVSVPTEDPAGYTQVSAEAKDAIAAYLDPAQDSTQTYGEIFDSLMEKYPDVDYNHVDFAMDTAEVFSANVESGAVYSEDTARGLFDSMYEIVMNNEPVNDGFSKSDLYDMTFREVVSDTGEPVCREDMFIGPESGESPSGNPGESADPDSVDLSGTSPLGEAAEITAPAAELPLEIQTDPETIPGIGDSVPGDLTDYYASAIRENGATGADEALPSADAGLDMLENEPKQPDSFKEPETSVDPVSVPEEVRAPDIELSTDTEIPTTDEAIPDTEIQLSEGAAEDVTEPDLESAVVEEAEAEEIAAALL